MILNILKLRGSVQKFRHIGKVQKDFDEDATGTYVYRFLVELDMLFLLNFFVVIA
jgi:hypothetical protein